MQDGFSKDHPLTAYILLATGMYHWRRGNVTGASRTMNRAMLRFRQIAPEFDVYHDEVAIDEILYHIKNSLDCMQSGDCFNAFPLPVSPALLAAAENAKSSLILLPKNSESVIHKHMQRDRSDILLQREEKKKGSS